MKRAPLIISSSYGILNRQVKKPFTAHPAAENKTDNPIAAMKMHFLHSLCYSRKAKKLL
jgi:hypothetical protein